MNEFVDKKEYRKRFDFEYGIEIGKYKLFFFKNGRISIENSEGEGMETSIEKLEQLLDKFWQEEF